MNHLVTKEELDIIIKKYGDKAYNEFKKTPFPYYVTSGNIIKECKNELINLFANKERDDKTPSKIIKHFHKSMWEANKSGSLSPVEYWKYLQENKEAFIKFYSNRLSCSDYYKRNEETKKELFNGIVPLRIYQVGLTTGGFAPIVSYFKPSLSKRLINTYLEDCKQIFAPTAGYSAHLLGAVCLGKEYVGQDINTKTVKETNEIIKFIKEAKYDINATTIVKDAIKDKGKYEGIISCPPYGDKETWGQKIEVKDCNEWIEIITGNYQAKKYVIIVDGNIDEKWEKYVVEEIENYSYFHKNIERKDGKSKKGNNYEKILLIK